MNYGCGHNDKIHTFIGSTTNRYYKSDIEKWGSSSALLAILLTAMASEYAVLAQFASWLFNQFASDAPDLLVIKESIFSVSAVGGGFLFYCHHFFIGEYTLNEASNSYTITKSYDRYETSTGGVS